MQGVQTRCARQEELKPAQKVIIAGSRHGIKNPTTQSSVLPAKMRILAHAAQEGAEQTQGGKAVQTEMNKHDRQGLQVSGRSLNTNITVRSEHPGESKPGCQMGLEARARETQGTPRGN